MRKADEISLEELYQILHVSKRKATWMLEHGIIPCRKRDTATHKYAIKLEDVLEYLKKDEIERDKAYPGKWYEKSGRILVEWDKTKLELIREVSLEIKKIRN